MNKKVDKIEFKQMTINNRILVRPSINWKHTIAFILIINSLDILITIFIFWTVMGHCSFKNWDEFIVWTLVYISTVLLSGIIFSRIIVIWIIKIYQRYAKMETRMMCCYIPSCSEYAILAVKKYGTFYGMFKAVKRIIKCGSQGGVDYP